MNTTRRRFISTASATSLPVLLTRPAWAEAPGGSFLETLGLQLWTVRDQMKADAPGTLKAVKAAGYHQVEMGDVTAEGETYAIAKDLGLAVTSSFMDWTSLGRRDGEANFEPSLEAAKDMGLDYLVFGYIGKGNRETPDDFHRLGQRLNEAGAQAKTAGIQLCYHNHSFEFAPLGSSGKCGYDILLSEMDADAWKMEFDIFWAAIGGWEPVGTLETKLKGKVSQLHLKDLKAGASTEYDEGNVPNEAFQECGDGTIDMAAICTAGKEAGATQAHVEQDQSPAPLASVAQSYRYLSKNS